MTNQVNGLVYYFYEEHTYDENNYCSQCGGSMHYHDYTYSYLYFNSRVHRSFCECGSTSMGAHIVDISNIHYCILCGGYAEYGLVGPLNHDEGL